MAAKVLIKVCGLREPANIQAVAELSPHYMGFIFAAQSPRYVGAKLNPVQLQHLDPAIKKCGVFVNAAAAAVADLVRKYFLNAVQLHGDESPEFCAQLKKNYPGLEIIKAWGIDADFDFRSTSDYESVCDYYLFDTKSRQGGGSGRSFDWARLAEYRRGRPFFLSGGLQRNNFAAALSVIMEHSLGAGVDINSGVERAPGLKSISRLQELLALVPTVGAVDEF